MSIPHLLIIGAGSVGKRHLRNFTKLGARVSAFDPRADRLGEAGKEVRLEGCHTSLEEAWKLANSFDGVVICSPPTFHVDQTIAALQRSLPVFLEKPVSIDADSASKLRDQAHISKAPVLLGYTYRWWPPLREFKKRILSGEAGSIRFVDCMMSAHLADWHPWEKYQDFFMAQRELGGGALLDESHFLDLILWIFGRPEEVFARVEKISDLDINTDDHVQAILEYASGLRVSIHLDLYGRPHEKYIRTTGLNGTLHWSFDPNRIRFGASMNQDWKDQIFACERNDMFMGAAAEFLELIREPNRPLTCSVQDGLDVLSVIEAMRQSSAEKRMVRAVYC